MQPIPQMHGATAPSPPTTPATTNAAKAANAANGDNDDETRNDNDGDETHNHNVRACTQRLLTKQSVKFVANHPTKLQNAPRRVDDAGREYRRSPHLQRAVQQHTVCQKKADVLQLGHLSATECVCVQVGVCARNVCARNVLDVRPSCFENTPLHDGTTLVRGLRDSLERH